MNVKIFPSKVSGNVQAPPSKSVTHRAIILASLASGISTIKNPLLSDDTKHTIEALRQLGVKIEENEDGLIVYGTDGNLTAPKEPINLGNSGTSMRLLTGVAALAKGTTVLTGEKRLQERPMGVLLRALNELGVRAKSLNNNDCPPVEIHGGTLSGGSLTIDANLSQQPVSSLLLVAPFAKKDIEITIQNLRSKPYLAITIDLMKNFGINVENNNFQNLNATAGQTYKAQNYTVEGDYSSASYFFAAAAITGSSISVKGLNPSSKQGDAYFLDILEQMGCTVQIENTQITLTSPKTLKQIAVDMGDYPDIVQTLVVVATFAKGKTIIKNISHLRYKETDRIANPAREFQKMGIKTEVSEDSLIIYGGTPNSSVIETYNDHRMAMSFAIAGLAIKDGITIQNAEVVNKSYPEFWNDLQAIGTHITMNHEQ